MSQRVKEHKYFPNFYFAYQLSSNSRINRSLFVQFATFLLLRMVLNISKSKSPKAHVINFATENLYLIEAVL